MNPITIFKGSSGLNTKIDPVRIKFDPETGIDDLAVAVNVDHDSTGRVTRRKGFAATSRTESIHSLFCEDGKTCLFVTDTSLCQLHTDYDYTSLATVTSGARVDYCQVGPKVFWVNGHQKGFVENWANNNWTKGTYYGPTSTRQLSDPPVGSLLAYHGGRMYVIQANTAWYSEPYNLNAFNLAENFLWFEDAIRMACPVDDGIFFGTDRKTYFIAGFPPQAAEKTIASYPPVEGTAKRIDLSKFGNGQLTGIGWIWTSTKGICVGGPQGLFLNATEKKLEYNNARYGAGIVIDDRYVATLQP